MINKIRRKFIIAAMLSVTAVLIVIIGGMTVVNYIDLVSSADNTVDILLLNDGKFPAFDHSPNRTQPFDNRNFSPETPFETRYFSAFANKDGEVVSCNLDFVASIDADEARVMAQDIINKNTSSGFYGRYRFGVKQTNNGTLIVCLDCVRSLETFRSFLLSGVLLSIVGIAAVFALVLAFSGVISKPIAESYEKQHRFITDVSHELKTPLAIINANAEVLEAENGCSEWTDSIKNQVENLSDLTQNLILLSRMEEGPAPVMKSLSLSELVTESITPFYTLAAAGNKTFVANIDSDINIRGNDAMLRRLVSILSDNAIKYSNDNGVISVCLKKTGKNAVLSFENPVDHIEPGDRKELFDRFVRADSSRNSQTGGYGIGLSIAKAIADSHNASISAFSSNGKVLYISVAFKNQ